MCELGDEELSVRKPTEKEEVSSTFRDIGYYTDSRGYKRYGVIPLKGEELNERARPSRQDD